GPADRPPRARPQIADWQKNLGAELGGGPAPRDLPASLSGVPFEWTYVGERFAMELLGGFLGVTQDPDGTVAPELGWAVRQKA
ncbi:MAG: hypothetical protein AAFU79_37690, partial [Myxococcota bacterium]